MPNRIPITRPRPRAAGFSLIEVLVVMVILGILAAIVLPSYQSSLYRSRRSDAMAALTKIQQAQERWRGNATSYQATLADLPGARESTSPSQYYDLSIVTDSVSASGYTARATATSGSKQAGDSACQVLEVQLTGGTFKYRSYTSANALNGAPDPCWVK
jgi:type IV pilus assembly protein PilE